MQQRTADEQPRTKSFVCTLGVRFRSTLWAIANRADRGAKRVALFTAISQGKRPIELAVSCIDAHSHASPSSRMPRGACRQVMQKAAG